MSSDFRDLWTNCTYDQYENATGFPFSVNSTQEPPLTHERSYTVLIIYFFLFVVAAVGNLSVFISLFRIRHRKSRINLMIRHLTMADLVVTFIMLPMEIGWRLTVQWLAGNFACKAFVFLRAFGLYLSSNVLVCVSVDRYFAVLHPLKVNDARRRGKCMLAWAWSVSLICAIPQSIIFHVMPHPNNPDFHQCVTHGSFSSNIQQTAYNIFGLLVMYFFPLTVIIGAYTAIMCEISNKSKENKEDTYQTTTGRMRLRRSDISNIERARTRTLRMTIMIVVVFIICWTPYVVMTLWYTFDEETIGRIPNWLQDTLFMMAVSNSCMNPLVYGSYAINFRKQCCKFFCCSTSSSQRNLADKQTGQCSGLLAHLIKYVLNMKVGSGVTRSTTILQTVANRSPISRPDNHCTGLLPKKLERPINFNHISFLSEQASRRCYRQSFHSDPYPCPDDVVGDNSQNSCGSDAHALANLL